MINLEVLKEFCESYNVSSGYRNYFTNTDSCIIVGRNKSLTEDHRNGMIIDSFQNIIRINTGPISDFELYTGQKPGLMFTWFSEKNNKQFAYNTTAVNDMLKYLTQTNPTTGFVCILMSLFLFKKVYIIGFNIYADADPHKWNYFEPDRQGYVATHHNLRRENEVLVWLAARLPLISLDNKTETKEALIHEIYSGHSC
jgi:hypothetical protein